MRRTEGTAPKGLDVTIDVTWLGHSTVVVDIDGVRIVADPLLRRHAGVLRRRGRRPDREAWSDPDAVLPDLMVHGFGVALDRVLGRDVHRHVRLRDEPGDGRGDARALPRAR